MVIADGEAIDECDEGFGNVFREDLTKKLPIFLKFFWNFFVKFFSKQLKSAIFFRNYVLICQNFQNKKFKR